MTLREQVEERNRQWLQFHEWEAEQPLPPIRDASTVLADLSWLLRWCPPELLETDPDPQKLGIAKMRAGLALLRGTSSSPDPVEKHCRPNDRT